MSYEDRYKNIGTISIVMEPKSYEQYGELTGGFDDNELRKYIAEYGHSHLLEKLTYMQWRVWQTVRELNSEESNKNVSAR